MYTSYAEKSYTTSGKAWEKDGEGTEGELAEIGHFTF